MIIARTLNGYVCVFPIAAIRSRFETTTPPGFSTVTAKALGFFALSRASIGTTTSPF